MSDLKLYQCHKLVHARPMTLGEFKEFANKPDLIGSPDAEGYLVVYSQGTPEEYHSWSPKAVFDDGYKELNQ